MKNNYVREGVPIVTHMGGEPAFVTGIGWYGRTSETVVNRETTRN